jgi:hypothetical protein
MQCYLKLIYTLPQMSCYKEREKLADKVYEMQVVKRFVY